MSKLLKKSKNKKKGLFLKKKHLPDPPSLSYLAMRARAHCFTGAKSSLPPYPSFYLKCHLWMKACTEPNKLIYNRHKWTYERQF